QEPTASPESVPTTEQAEAARLASAADAEMESYNGNAETAALLSIRSLKTSYTPQADVTLAQALSRMDKVRTFSGHTEIIESVAFSPDGKTVLTGSRDGTARLWDVQTGANLHTLSYQLDWVGDAIFSPDGKTILTGGLDGTAQLWDVQTGKRLHIF